VQVGGDVRLAHVFVPGDVADVWDGEGADYDGHVC